MLATTALAAYAMQATAQNQMRTWTLPPNRFNFAPTAGSAALPLATNEQYRVANGAYDANGNLLFYVKNLNVYKADGNMIGTMQYSTIPLGTSNTYSIPQKEIAIVPISGSCKKYLVIWLGVRFSGSGFALRSVEVNLEGANPVLTETVATNTANDIIPGNLHAGLAVSKAESNGNRKLYVVTNLGYRMYNITSTGVSPFVAQATWPASPTYPSSIYPSDVELSHDGSKIAWGSVESGQVFAASLDATKAISNTSLNKSTRKNSDLISATFGVEFMPNGDLYYSVRSGNTKVGDGIYKVTASNVPASLTGTRVDTTTNNANNNTNSHIELGYDGFLYMVNTSGKLVKFNIANNSSALSTSFTQTIVSNGAVQLDMQYSLPDQIDGENYANFRGIGTLIYPTPIVKSNGTVVTPASNIYTVYNCKPVTLASTTSNYKNYTLTIFASSATGTVGTQLYTSGAVSAAYPDAQDIALLATNIRTTPGYYLVRLKFSNGCDGDITQDLIINSQNQFTYTGLQASNNGVLLSLTSGAYNVFNCKSIGLTPTSTNAVQYRFSIQSSNATGGVVSGIGTTNYVESWLNGPFPTSYDLGTVNGNYLKTHTGYFLLTVEQKDNCNPVLSRNALLKVSTLSATTADYSFVAGDGNSYDPDFTTLAAPAQLGTLALGINPKGSDGYIETYTMTIEKMNQSNGTVLQTVCNFPVGTAVPGNTYANTQQPFIGLNYYTFNKCGQVSSYFNQVANQNQVYKLSLKMANTCGTSVAKVGYFQNSIIGARMGDVEEITSTQETLASQGHAMYPNPSTGKATLQYVLENETNVSLSITDAQGNKMATVLDNVSKSIGTYTQAIDLANLPDGIYYYRLNTDKAIVGKIVKTTK